MPKENGSITKFLSGVCKLKNDMFDLYFAASAARDVLREVATNRKKYGPLSTKAQHVVHQLNAALDPQ